MTYENWWNIFQMIGVGLVALTFTVGAIAFLLGYWTRQEKDKKAQEQRERIEELKNNTAQLEKEVADAKTKQAEAERALLTLEKSLARRQLPFIIGEEGKTNIDVLKSFAEFNAVVEFLPEVEARRATLELTGILKQAGWNIVSVTPNPELDHVFWDGVKIEPYNVSGLVLLKDESGEMHRSRSKSIEAAEALESFLRSNNWEAMQMAGKPGDLPLNTVRIRIGFKSFPRVRTPEEEEIFKKYPVLDSKSLTK